MGFFNHKRHSIARPHGRAMECVVRIFDKIDGVIRALYCIYVYIYVCVRVCVLHISVLDLLHLHMFIYILTMNIFYMKTEWLLMIYTVEFLIKQEENVFILVPCVFPCIYTISHEAEIRFVNITSFSLSVCLSVSRDCHINVADKVRIHLEIVM